MSWYTQPAKEIDLSAVDRAIARQTVLTKPPGSLGQLEQLAIRLCGMLGDTPSPDRPAVVVFAADHGVAEENVSAFPQVVTGEMVRNFAAGGAAICVLSKAVSASLEVVHLGTVNDPGVLNGVVRCWIAPSTANFSRQPAMEPLQFDRALGAGRDAVIRANKAGKNVFVGGDMGIANTTAATALICACLGASPAEVAGPGTGLDQRGIRRKIDVVETALALHRPVLDDPVALLRCLGGFEITALAGAYIAAAQQGIPAVVDGFIAASAALVAIRLNPGIAQWLQMSHVSAEPGFAIACASLEAAGAGAPLIDLGMRLGEGSGAGVVLPLLQTACRLHNEMATFSEAGVSAA